MPYTCIIIISNFIITGDALWFYWRQIGKKPSNASWVAENEKPRTVVRQGRFKPKTKVCIFFRTTGAERITYWDRAKTIDHKSYIDHCLKHYFYLSYVRRLVTKLLKAIIA